MKKSTDDDTRIFTLARTFSEKAHAVAFLRGSIRMQTVEYFRNCEHTDKALRGDAYEGLSALFQPKNISELVIGGVVLPPTALAGPMTFHSERVKHWHVFCLHAIGHTPDDPQDFDSIEAMRRSILLHEDTTRFGKHVVYLKQPNVFLHRVHDALRALGYASRSKLVSYYDELLFTGWSSDADAPFKKSKRFAYQKEYRIVAKTPAKVSTPLVVEIGDLSDVAELTTAEKFNDSISLSVNAKRDEPERCQHAELVDDCARPCAGCGHACRAHGRSGPRCSECACLEWQESQST